MIQTESSPSVSFSRISTISVLEVGTVLPVKSAWMGSSRWPRSTSTASLMEAGRPQVQLCGLDHGVGGDGGEVVAVERDVKGPQGNFFHAEGLQRLRDAFGDGNAAGMDPDQHHVFEIGIGLRQLRGDPMNGACQRRVIGNLLFRFQRHSVLPHRTPGEGCPPAFQKAQESIGPRRGG